MVIKLTNLTKNYGEHRGILDVDLSVKKGEIFGFVGPNGAGKSTTIRVLLNLLFKSSGYAEIFGLDVEKSSKEIKKHIGYVPSEVSYYDFMKVIDVLAFVKTFDKDVTEDSINEICMLFDIDKNRNVNELSLGNKKKVAIAQAILRKPKLLILDEPTSGLDPLIQKKLFEFLIKLKESGTTIFLSSHNLNEVEKYCDRVAIIKEGKILSVQSIEEIRKRTKKHVKVKYRSGEVKEYLYDKDVKELINNLAKEDIIDIEIRNTSLEESFIEIYGIKGDE